MKIIMLESYGDLLEFAEELGWNQTEAEESLVLGDNEEWTCSASDGLEQDALDFIEEKGFEAKDVEDFHTVAGFDVNYAFVSV